MVTWGRGDRIDLHTHSLASDGTDTPDQLVRAAAAAGLQTVAITDHDTAAGWAEAARAAEQVGIRLVRGMEISTRYRGRGVHLLAYLVDAEYPPLAAELERILAGRDERVPAMVARLQELGSRITLADVHRAAGSATATGRPHVADALARLGEVNDRDEAFARYLADGGPAYVDRYAGSLVDVIDLVTAAGGVSVVAHPWGRHDRRTLDPQTLADLARRGLAGVEVDHVDHGPRTRAELRAVARDLGLVVTGSSDHHGSGKTGHELGCNTTEPAELDRLLARAAVAAARSGRDVPAVVGA